MDRKSLGLPSVQLELLRAVQAAVKKPITLVLVNGSPLTLGPDELKCNAIVEAWYPGMQGGNALADILLGKASPSGRLPVTIVKSIADLPPFTEYTMKARTYRYPGPVPQFPFGFGLSYTKFEYSGFSLPKTVDAGAPLTARVYVKNVGKVEGDEVVQVYRHFVAPRKPMPEQQLVAFRRVHLKPGAGKLIAITIPAEQLKVLYEDTEFHSEPGKIAFTIGGGQPGYSKTLKAVVTVR